MSIRALIVATLAGTAIGSGALAQAPGTVVFTDLQQAASSGQAIRSWFGGVVSTHVTFPAESGSNPFLTNTRLSDIRVDTSTNIWYYGSGPIQTSPATNARIGRVQNLFGAPVLDNLATSNPAINPLGMVVDQRTNSLIYANNTANNTPPGVIYPASAGGQNAVSLPAPPGVGTQTRIWNQVDPLVTLPTPLFAQFMVADPRSNASTSTSDYYTTFANGGTALIPQGTLPANQNWSSIITRTSFATIAAGSATNSILVDFNGTSTYTDQSGATQTVPLLTDVRGIAARPGSNELYISDNFTKAIWRLILDASGTALVDIRQVIGGLSDPEVLRWDPYTNTLVFGEIGAAKRLSRVNPDGTGYTVLASDVLVRGIDFIPTPGAAALLGLGGLVAARRRRA